MTALSMDDLHRRVLALEERARAEDEAARAPTQLAGGSVDERLRRFFQELEELTNLSMSLYAEQVRVRDSPLETLTSSEESLPLPPEDEAASAREESRPAHSSSNPYPAGLVNAAWWLACSRLPQEPPERLAVAYLKAKWRKESLRRSFGPLLSGASRVRSCWALREALLNIQCQDICISPRASRLSR